MGRSSTKWTRRKILQRRKEGHGQGTLSTYKPWVTVRDFSSQGTTTRLFSPRLNRVVTLFSNIERNTFLFCEQLTNFRDYWEQKDVDVELSLRVADDLGINHPFDLETNEPAIVTLDGVLSLANDPRHVIDCVPEKRLATRREQEKLALRREIARRLSYGYRLFTENSVPRTVVHNLQWIRMSVQRTGELSDLSADERIHEFRRFVEELATVWTGAPNTLLADFLAKVNQGHAPAGFSHWALRRLAWDHHLSFKLDVPFRSLLAGPVSQLMLAPSLCAAASQAQEALGLATRMCVKPVR